MTYHAVVTPLAQMQPRHWDGWLTAQAEPLFQHSYSYGEVMGTEFASPLCVQVYRKDTVAAQAICFSYRAGPIAWHIVPTGLCLGSGCEVQQAYRALLAALSDQRLSLCVISAPAGALPSNPVMTGGTDAIWNLPQTDTQLEQAMQQKWRNRLYKARTEDMTVDVGGADSSAMAWLEREEMAQRQVKKYRMLPANTPRRLAKASGAIAAICVAVRCSGQYVAAASFICFGSEAVYFSGVTTALGRPKSAQHLVLAHAAEFLVRRGYKRINLGLINTHAAPGLARFKLGTGAQASPRMSTYTSIGRTK
ncbi:MAG: GNAT family N-acetyltransferase [Pseudomonadota bacterium]